MSGIGFAVGEGASLTGFLGVFALDQAAAPMVHCVMIDSGVAMRVALYAERVLHKAQGERDVLNALLWARHVTRILIVAREKPHAFETISESVVAKSVFGEVEGVAEALNAAAEGVDSGALDIRCMEHVRERHNSCKALAEKKERREKHLRRRLFTSVPLVSQFRSASLCEGSLASNGIASMQ